MSPYLLALVLHSFSWQKPVIDTAAIARWPSLAILPEISAAGNYLAYAVIRDEPAGPILIIRASNSKWKKKIGGAARCYFTDNEKQAILQKNDSLHFIILGTDSERMVRASSCQWPSAATGHWLAYQEKPGGRLTLLDLLNDSQQDLGMATQYGFDPQGRVLAIADKEGLDYIKLETGDRHRILVAHEGEALRELRWDMQGLQLAFLITGKTNAVFIFRVGDTTARSIVNDTSVGGPLVFSRDAKWLFFRAAGASPEAPKTNYGSGNPQIWGWQDASLQPIQPRGATGYWAAAETGGTIVKQLESPIQRLLTPPEFVTGPRVLVSRVNTYWLLSLRDGTQRRVGSKNGYPADFCFSPGGNWFIYYDAASGQYWSCDTRTGTLRPITAALPHGVSSEFPHSVEPQAVAEPAGWLHGDSMVLLYDNYDCWAVDPAGIRAPYDLTCGYGWRHHVKLRLVGQQEGSNATEVFASGDTLLLTGFNTQNKYNGFFRQILGRKKMPDSLFMGPYTFYRVESQKPHRYSFDDGMRPLHPARAGIWLVKRESAIEAPNYFLTPDFRQWKQITDFAPQRDYNWLTAELVNYTQLDGSPGQGVLYKPENFDPSRRYPILFNVYEQLSHRLYEFPRPGLSRDNINIPWFVSRGYLVFTPDISYQSANQSDKTVGAWACQSILGAARYLRRLPFVDGNRMGIQGHSLGAEETIDILANTGIFAAAAEMAGPTDPVSAYLTLLPADSTPIESRENQYIWERGQARLGATLWQRPDLYLRESGVLHADKITTPLLIVHNPRDAAVQWRQGVELFMALRRLQKPVWLLQYPDEDHSFLQPENALDYTLRLTDFFGHFLRNQSLPVWMEPQH